MTINKSCRARQIARKLTADSTGEYASPFRYYAADDHIFLMMVGFPVAHYNLDTHKTHVSREIFEKAVQHFPRQPSFEEFMSEDASRFFDKVKMMMEAN